MAKHIDKCIVCGKEFNNYDICLTLFCCIRCQYVDIEDYEVCIHKHIKDWCVECEKEDLEKKMSFDK